MQKLVRRRRLLRQTAGLVASLTATVGLGIFAVSCSGGSSGGGFIGGAPGGTVPPNSPPTISSVSASSQSVPSGAGFALQVQATDPNGDPLTYTWSQLSGSGASISGASLATASVTAPLVQNQETLTFQIEVSDGNGPPITGSVSVAVTPTGSTAIAVIQQDVTYDELGRVTETRLTDASGGTVRIAYGYDDDGNLVSRELIK